VAFIHSRASVFYANGVDLTTYLAKTSSGKTVDMAETSNFGTTFKTYVPGLTDATMQVEGYFDGGVAAITAQLQTLLALDPSLFTLYPGGDAAGNEANGFLGWESDFSVLTDITAAVKVTMSAQSKTGATPLTAGLAKSLFNTIATTNGSTFDTAAALTTLGGELHYHIFDQTGTGSPSTTINWQTSPTGSVWTTIATSGAITATGVPSYGRVVVASGVTMDVQSRIQVVTAGSTIAAHAAALVHRNLN
jgi:hypothetical protein